MYYKGRNSLKKFRFYEVYYERMIDFPEVFFRNLLTSVGLTHEQKFYETLATWEFKKGNN